MNPVTPGVIADGHHMVLEKTDHFTAGEGSLVSLGIENLQGRIIVKDLIHTVIVDFVPEAIEDVPGSEELGN